MLLPARQRCEAAVRLAGCAPHLQHALQKTKLAVVKGGGCNVTGRHTISLVNLEGIERIRVEQA